MKTSERFYEELLVLAEGLDKGIETTVRDATPQEQVVALMCLKITRHVYGAARLLSLGFYPESIILLRSAYECLVMSKYLSEKPADIARYEAHGVLCNLRNMVEFLSLVYLDSETKNPLEKQIRELKDAFCTNGIQCYPRLQATDLDDFDKIRSASNKALFSHLPNMLAGITWNDDNDWIKNGFELYNIGSQVTHSQMEWLAIGRFGKSEHAIFSKLAIGRYILMFLNDCSETLTELDLSSTARRSTFENQFANSLQLLQKWLAEEQQSTDERLRNQKKGTRN